MFEKRPFVRCIYLNPTAFVQDTLLAQSVPTAEDAVIAASIHTNGLVLVTRDRVPKFDALGTRTHTVLKGPRWVLLDVS